MNERDRGEEATRVPAQQAQQPQPSSTLNSHAQLPHLLGGHEEKTLAISQKMDTDGHSSRGSGGGDDPEDGSPPGIDEARFTAGVVKLYEALLKEPVPDEMLRLIEQLGQQERK